jgi:hypothetical protein
MASIFGPRAAKNVVVNNCIRWAGEIKSSPFVG